MNSGTFNWQSLGKPDYSHAHAYVASLPEGIRCQMDGTDKELTARILHLSWIFSQRSGRGSAYCWPTLTTLARYVGRCTRTVERHMEKLNTLGLISWKRRTTSTGGWTSNLYQIGKTFIASLFARKGKKVQQFRDTTKVSDNDLKREYKAAPNAGSRPYTSPSWMEERGKPLASSWNSQGEAAPVRFEQLKREPLRTIEYVPADEWDIADAKDAENQRREQLRKQAEMLRKRGL